MPELWIVDLQRGRLLRFTGPDGAGAYGREEAFAKTDVLRHEWVGQVRPAELLP